MADDKENIIRTTIRMPQTLHKDLTDEIQRRKYTPEKTSIDRAVQDAIEHSDNTTILQTDKVRDATRTAGNESSAEIELRQLGKPPFAFSEVELPWVQKLLKVLRSDRKQYIDNAQNNLDLLADFCDHEQPAVRDKDKLPSGERGRATGETSGAHLGSPGVIPPKITGTGPKTRRESQHRSKRKGS